MARTFPTQHRLTRTLSARKRRSSSYTYNALGCRTSKTFDASKGAYDGVMEQKRVFTYDASWRIIEEHTDIDFDDDVGTDWVSQQFWGLRYIDDLVAKRVDRDADGNWTDSDASRWYFITDSQFGVAAVLDSAKHLWERVEYDAYGNARHRYAGDATGDGAFGFGDVVLYTGFPAIGDGNYHADLDLDFDGVTDATDTGIIGGRSGAMSTALPGGWIGDPSSDLGPDNSVGYAGYVFNPEREDYSVRFRVYSPELGRWRTKDPLVLSHFVIQLETLALVSPEIVDDFLTDFEYDNNLFSLVYQYVLSSPVRPLDPTGLVSTSPPFFDPTDPANFGRKPGVSLKDWRKIYRNAAKSVGKSAAFGQLLAAAACLAAMVEMELACYLYFPDMSSEGFAACFCEQLASPPGAGEVPVRRCL